MLNRRQVLASFASSVALVATVGRVKSQDGTSCNSQEVESRSWIPQLSKTAPILAESESRTDRFAAELVHQIPFMAGIVLILHKTSGHGAEGRLQRTVASLRRRGIAISTPGISSDKSTWALFACSDEDQLRHALRPNGTA